MKRKLLEGNPHKEAWGKLNTEMFNSKGKQKLKIRDLIFPIKIREETTPFLFPLKHSLESSQILNLLFEIHVNPFNS